MVILSHKIFCHIVFFFLFFFFSYYLEDEHAILSYSNGYFKFHKIHFTDIALIFSIKTFTFASKWIKYLGINLYSENYKVLMKEIEDGKK